MDYMKDVPDKYFDLAIVDPPYGIGGGLKGGRPFSMVGGDKWDIPPSESYFNKLITISKNQIIWGGNYFNIGRTRGFIIWDKQNDGRDFSECEFAWTSFDRPSRIFRMRFIGKKDTNHPTVKPIKLIGYLQRLITPPGGITYDPFGGSGTSGISANIEGFKWIISEDLSEHCDIAEARIKAWKIKIDSQQKFAFE